jgi:phosphorylcholine metabolism protein LicD
VLLGNLKIKIQVGKYSIHVEYWNVNHINVTIRGVKAYFYWGTCYINEQLSCWIFIMSFKRPHKFMLRIYNIGYLSNSEHIENVCQKSIILQSMLRKDVDEVHGSILWCV